MNTVTFTLLLLALLGLTTGYWLRNANGFSDEEDEEPLVSKRSRGAPSFMRSQSRDLCIPWRSPCTMDRTLIAKYYFLRCCSGMACRCTVWGKNCKCEARFG